MQTFNVSLTIKRPLDDEEKAHLSTSSEEEVADSIEQMKKDVIQLLKREGAINQESDIIELDLKLT
ncbi:hypothetical protein ACQCN2_00970 [Brevibacillus ginsengisoli]|uniref:hypothetical protein n=1 Tax=Brevibacillus ginsengisoli TaxID=363854 RepID=UPI003CF5FA59